MGKSSTSFSSEYQPKKRTPRGPCKKNVILNAIRETCGNENEYAKKVVLIGLEEKNSTLLTHAIEQIQPKRKSELPEVKFTFDPDGPPFPQALAIFHEVSKGNIAPDTGKLLIETLALTLQIEEGSELRDKFKDMLAMIDELKAKS